MYNPKLSWLCKVRSMPCSEWDGPIVRQEYSCKLAVNKCLGIDCVGLMGRLTELPVEY